MKGLFNISSVLGLLAAAVIYLGISLPQMPRFDRGDLLDYFIPVADYVGHTLANKEFPFWNDRAGCGFDQVGGAQAGLFYPFTWMNAVFPVSVAMAVLVLGHLCLLIVGFHKWLSLLGVGAVAAIVGAAVIGFGLIAEAWWPPMFYTLTWLPWILWAIERCGTWYSSVALLAVFIALASLAGFPQYLCYSMIIVGTYALGKALTARTIRPLIQLALGVMFAGGLAASQLVITSNYVKECWRGAGPLAPSLVHYYDGDGHPGESANGAGITAKHFVRTIFNSVDNVRPDNPRSLSSRAEFGYLGFLVPFGVFLALTACRRWELVFFTALGLIGVYLSLGYLGRPIPLYKWLAELLPMFGAFRSPDRLQMWSVISFGVVTAFGFDELRKNSPNQRLLVIGTIAFGMLLLVIRLAALVIIERSPNWTAVGVWSALTIVSSLCILQIVRPTAIRDVRLKQAGQYLLCLLLFADFVASGRYVARWHESPKPFYTSMHHSHSVEKIFLNRSEIAEIAGEAGHERIYIAEPYRPIMPTASLPFFRTLPFYEPMIPLRHLQLHNAIKHIEESKPQSVAFNYWDVKAVPHLQWFDWCSVKWLVTATEIEGAEACGWKLERKTESGARIYENLRVIKRAALFPTARFGTSRDALNAITESPMVDSPPMPVLERPPLGDWNHVLLERPNLTNTTGHLKWIRDDPQNITLEVEAEDRAVLVLSDSWFPGWECRIDGVATAILRANFIHRAVLLTPGRHQVVFRYCPVGLRLGIAISAAAAFLLVLFFGVLEASRRNRARQQSFKVGEQ